MQEPKKKEKAINLSEDLDVVLAQEAEERRKKKLAKKAADKIKMVPDSLSKSVREADSLSRGGM